MNRMFLNGRWSLLERSPEDAPVQQLAEKILKADDWMDTEVPGDVNITLQKHGKIPDPHYDINGRKWYWVTTKDWWYRLEFNLDKSSFRESELCLANVDGNADIWLNGEYLGEMKNAFRPHRFAIRKENLRENENTLYIRFRSIENYLGARLDDTWGWKGKKAFIRKPQYSCGWDWALPLPSIGLGGDVWLEYDNSLRLEDFSLQPFITGRVDFDFEVSPAAKESGYEISVRVWGHGANLQKSVSRDAYKSYLSLSIPEQNLWFPNGYGDPVLYNYKAELVSGGKVMDSRTGKFGLRESKTVEYPFTPEAGPGFAFTCEINGVPIFIKGVNWIPMELWPAAIRPEDYRFYLEKAKEANFNMIRIWGGGIYEPDLFYELCDELGIMVWQDFMFASNGYPLELLRDEIIEEAMYQIKRLKNHPCIVIWCGCNEDVFSWKNPCETAQSLQADDTGGDLELKKWKVDRLKYDPQLYTMLLRGLISKYGLGVPYLESSPQSRDDFGNMPNSGNCHISCLKYCLFESWDRPREFRKHFDEVCSFDSEFCIHGPCSVETYKKFLDPKNIWPPNDAWIFHIQTGHRRLPYHVQTMRLAGDTFGEINSLQEYVKYGQAMHVEMMRAEYESARRDRPNNGGTMVWMYNDCWPTSNWSIIDYYKNPKPSYYAAKRACAPLLPIILERKGRIEFFFSNESPEDVKVGMEYGQQSLEGKKKWARTQELVVRANTVVKFDVAERADLSLALGEFLYIGSHVDGGCSLDEVTFFPDGWRDVLWPQPGICMEVLDEMDNGAGWETRLRVSTNAFARLAHVLYDDDNMRPWFSDNYYDLPAGRCKEVTVYSDQSFDKAKLKTGSWLTEWR